MCVSISCVEGAREPGQGQGPAHGEADLRGGREAGTGQWLAGLNTELKRRSREGRDPKDITRFHPSWRRKWGHRERGREFLTENTNVEDSSFFAHPEK